MKKLISIFLLLIFVSCDDKDSITAFNSELFQAATTEISEKIKPFISGIDSYKFTQDLVQRLPKDAQIATNISSDNPEIKEEVEKALAEFDKTIIRTIKANPTLIKNVLKTVASNVDLSTLEKTNPSPVSTLLESKLKAKLKPTLSSFISPLLKEKRTDLGNKSPEEAWAGFVTAYNLKALLTGGTKIPTDIKLEEFIAEKVLDILFEEMKKQEVELMKDPASKVSQLLKL